jgi:hypothetical protein
VIEYQDVAMQYLMHGREGLNKLYTENSIPPEVSGQAWEKLSEGKSIQELEGLASFLVCAHMPLREARAPSILPPKAIMPEA